MKYPLLGYETIPMRDNQISYLQTRHAIRQSYQNMLHVECMEDLGVKNDTFCFLYLFIIILNGYDNCYDKVLIFDIHTSTNAKV